MCSSEMNTIEELQGQVWEQPDFDSSLVSTCHRLRKKPIGEFTVEDLRLMIGQNIGTEHLMPRALDMLDQDPFIWDYHYPGELLKSVLDLPEDYWREHPKQLEKTLSIAEVVLQELKEKWAERKEEARRLYGAQLDEEDCQEYPEGELWHWTRDFVTTHRTT